MSATSILQARSQIKNLSLDKMKELVDKAIMCSTTEEVLELVAEYTK